MLISLLPVPFADAARQRQFEALEAVLQAEADASGTVLLGNLGAWAGLAADALLVRPAGLVVLVLVPRAGHLTMPALAYGGWRLSGQPLPGREGADNPFTQYQQQAAPALAWLTAGLGLPAGQRPACRGLALLDGPLTFGPEVEAHLHQHAAARHFELLGNVAGVPAWLHRQFTAGPSTLDEDDLLDWADNLADTLAAHPLEPAAPAAPPAPHYLADKLRQLWRWLGAEDIPADPPYGGASLPDLAQRDQQEQARLHQLRQELQAELHQHRQEAAAREEARTQELAQLRQQLAQAGPSATARQTEQQAALEEALRTARAELAAQSQELDARIRQLGQLMQQLAAPANSPGAPASAPSLPTQSGSAPAAAPHAGAGVTVRSAPRAATRPVRAAGPLLKRASYRPLRRAERWSVLLLALALVGGGVWGMVQLVKRPANPARSAASHRARRASQASEAAQQPGPVIIYDTLASPTSPTTDAPDVTDDTPSAMPAASEAAPAEASPVLHADSAKLKVAPTPTPPGDSATFEASPAP